MVMPAAAASSPAAPPTLPMDTSQLFTFLICRSPWSVSLPLIREFLDAEKQQRKTRGGAVACDEASGGGGGGAIVAAPPALATASFSVVSSPVAPAAGEVLLTFTDFQQIEQAERESLWNLLRNAPDHPPAPATDGTSSTTRAFGDEGEEAGATARHGLLVSGEFDRPRLSMQLLNAFFGRVFGAALAIIAAGPSALQVWYCRAARQSRVLPCSRWSLISQTSPGTPAPSASSPASDPPRYASVYRVGGQFCVGGTDTAFTCTCSAFRYTVLGHKAEHTLCKHLLAVHLVWGFRVPAVFPVAAALQGCVQLGGGGPGRSRSQVGGVSTRPKVSGPFELVSVSRGAIVGALLPTLAPSSA